LEALTNKQNYAMMCSYDEDREKKGTFKTNVYGRTKKKKAKQPKI
jgi:hypothetical protein